MKKTLAILSTATLILTLTSCGTAKEEAPTTDTETTVAVEETTEDTTFTKKAETVTETLTVEVAETETEATKEEPGLNSTNVQEVLNFYVTAANAMPANMVVIRSKTLTKLDGGSGGAGSVISKLEGIAKNVLAKKSGEDIGIRGVPDAIQPGDIASASAKVNGDYTEVQMTVKDYTALPQGRAHDGSVGRVIGVLDTVNEALDELPMTIEDTSNIRLNYVNAKVVSKIDNNSGKIVSAEWSYDVQINIKDTKAKMGIPFNLDGMEVAIHYVARYN